MALVYEKTIPPAYLLELFPVTVPPEIVMCELFMHDNPVPLLPEILAPSYIFSVLFWPIKTPPAPVLSDAEFVLLATLPPMKLNTPPLLTKTPPPELTVALYPPVTIPS